MTRAELWRIIGPKPVGAIALDGTVEKALFTITCTTCQARLIVRLGSGHRGDSRMPPLCEHGASGAGAAARVSAASASPPAALESGGQHSVGAGVGTARDVASGPVASPHVAHRGYRFTGNRGNHLFPALARADGRQAGIGAPKRGKPGGDDNGHPVVSAIRRDAVAVCCP